MSYLYKQGCSFTRGRDNLMALVIELPLLPELLTELHFPNEGPEGWVSVSSLPHFIDLLIVCAFEQASSALW